MYVPLCFKWSISPWTDRVMSHKYGTISLLLLNTCAHCDGRLILRETQREPQSEQH